MLFRSGDDLRQRAGASGNAPVVCVDAVSVTTHRGTEVCAGVSGAVYHGQGSRGEGRGRGQRQPVRAVRRRGAGAVHRGQEEKSGKEDENNRDGESVRERVAASVGVSSGQW